ncbi:MAG: hypothetical protein ACD_62C00281G0008 [uncultured bacterium]|nr:MAG: hypothetical protein ACD_62C00281G0008 [uncultured bacterium]
MQNQNEHFRRLIHDLRTKMAAVNTFLFLLEDLPLDPETRQLYEKVIGEMEGMKGLVEEMGKNKMGG